MEHGFHQVTPAKHKLVDELYPHHNPEHVLKAGTVAISPRITFTKELAQMMTTAGDVVYCAISMTTDKSVDFQVCLYDAETDITTWNIADTNHVTTQQT